MTPPAKSLAVYCAAANGARPIYREVATELGRKLGERGIGLVYGGATVGLMGAVADAAIAAGAYTIGVMPQVLVDFEISHHGCSELHTVDTMHTRKAMMMDRADGFIVLPGGYGTFEELFEVVAWQTLKIHAKPIVLLNVDGFYDKLIAFLDLCDQEGMLRGNRHVVQVASTADQAIALALGES